MISAHTSPKKQNKSSSKKCLINNCTWFCELVAVDHRWGWFTDSELSLMNVTGLDSTYITVVIEGGNSLMTHKTNAEGTDEPENMRVRTLILTALRSTNFQQSGAIVGTFYPCLNH